ncbi:MULTISPECIES: hypothetical protein [Sinorhizobium]|uniref:Uncharacterized protein n=1 Tax=Sinorhizobium americanum TaxID=194963 RepID=A0A2S3YN86_9HYPH|nr:MULTISPECIES: hypothetical protein [Sinorhizobium]PDT32920.1 hypothetical protein CO656_28970 [Sinorhizobium sp. FG01]POH30524.1 hypothetical protein ATY31_14875 [Sinorhizobium americanum]
MADMVFIRIVVSPDSNPTHDDGTVLNFLVNPDARLNDRRPIDLLKAGDVRPVVEAATSA